MVCSGGPHNPEEIGAQAVDKKDRHSGHLLGGRPAELGGMCDYEARERRPGKLLFGICREACALLTAGGAVVALPDAGRSCRCTPREFSLVSGLERRLFCAAGGDGGDGGGDGWRQVPEQALPRAETFTTTCTNTILAPSTTQFPSPHPPPPPPPPHHPPSTIHPPPTGRPPQCSSECTRCLGAAV